MATDGITFLQMSREMELKRLDFFFLKTFFFAFFFSHDISHQNLPCAIFLLFFAAFLSPSFIAPIVSFHFAFSLCHQFLFYPYPFPPHFVLLPCIAFTCCYTPSRDTVIRDYFFLASPLSFHYSLGYIVPLSSLSRVINFFSSSFFLPPSSILS